MHNIGQTRDGLLWFSGPSGLSRYNGSRIENLTHKFKLTTHGLRSVTVAGNDDLYVATDMGIDRIVDGHCSPLSEPWHHGTVNCVVPSGDGILFSSSTGVYRADASGLNCILSGHFGLIHLDQNARLWAQDVDRMIRVLDTDLNDSQQSPTLDYQTLSCLTASSSDGVLLANREGLIEMFADGSRRTLDIPSVSAAMVDSDELWVCSRDRLIRYQLRAEQWQDPVVIDQNVRLNHLFRDGVGNIWGASDSRGVLKISALRNLIHQPIFESDGAVFYINRITDDRYIIGGKDFNVEVKANDPYCFGEHSSMDAGTVWDYVRYKDLELYATNNGFFRCEGSQLIKMFDDQPYLKAQGRVFHVQAETLWMGSRLGLARWVDGVVCPADTLGGDSLGYVYSIGEDPEGKLWVGTIDNGLWVLTELGFVKHPLRFVENQCSVYCISFNDQGDMLLLHDNLISAHSAHGVSRLIARTESNISGWSAVWDGDSVWVGGVNGLIEYDLHSKTQTRQVTALLGSQNWEFTTSKSLKLLGGRYLLCGLNSGLVIVDKTPLQRVNTRPRPQLDEIRWQNATVQDSGSGASVMPGKWTLTIRYFNTWFHNEENNRFRYTLVGFDDDWQLTELCEAHYNSLPVGQYRFEIQAYSPLTGWGEAVELLAFEVSMPWWARGWLSGLFSLYEASVGFVSSRWRNKVLNRRNQLLEETLEHRTREIREAYREIQQVNRNLMELANTDPLTGLANRRAFDQALGDELERALRYNGSLVVMMVDIDDFKRWNDRYGHDVGDRLLIQVAQVLAQSIRSGDTVCRFGGEEFSIILPQTRRTGARTVASQIIRQVSQIDTSELTTDQLHVSVGIAVREEDDAAIQTVDALLKRSDEALYRAKANGKNQFAD